MVQCLLVVDGSLDQSFTVNPNWFNKGCGIWDGAYKRSLAAKWKE